MVIGIGLAFLVLRERPAAAEAQAEVPSLELATELAAIESGGELVATAGPSPIRRRFVLPVRVSHAEQDEQGRVAA